MIHHAWLPSLCVTVKHGQRLMSSFEFVLFAPFFSGPPLALTHLLSINVCTTCRNNRPPAQLPVCLTHMNAHTQALPDTHTQTRTSLLTQAWMDAHTRRQLTRAESVLHSSSILYFHNAQMWCSAACVFSSLSPSPRSGFELYYFLLVQTFFPCGVLGGRKKREIKIYALIPRNNLFQVCLRHCWSMNMWNRSDLLQFSPLFINASAALKNEFASSLFKIEEWCIHSKISKPARSSLYFSTECFRYISWSLDLSRCTAGPLTYS